MVAFIPNLFLLRNSPYRPTMPSLQYKIFNKCLASAFLYAKLFGLWLYRIEHNRMKYDLLRVAYSISFYVSMLVGYLAVGRDFVVSVNKQLFVSFAFQSIFLLHTNIISISATSLFWTQFFHYEKRKCAYKKCKEVLNLVKFLNFKTADIRKYLFLFVTKTVVIDAFTFSAILFNWHLTASGGKSHSAINLVFTFLPILIIRFYTNLFYGGTLIIGAIFKQFNQNFNNVLLQAKLKLLHPRDKRGFNSLLTYSRLSEEIARFSALHSKLIEATEAFNSVFSIQVILSIISSLLTLVLRCFYEYIAIVEVTKKKNTEGFYRCVLMGFTVFLALYDLYSTCAACELLVSQVRMVLIKSVHLKTLHIWSLIFQ